MQRPWGPFLVHMRVYRCLTPPVVTACMSWFGTLRAMRWSERLRGRHPSLSLGFDSQTSPSLRRSGLRCDSWWSHPSHRPWSSSGPFETLQPALVSKSRSGLVVVQASCHSFASCKLLGPQWRQSSKLCSVKHRGRHFRLLVRWLAPASLRCCDGLLVLWRVLLVTTMSLACNPLCDPWSIVALVNVLLLMHRSLHPAPLILYLSRIVGAPCWSASRQRFLPTMVAAHLSTSATGAACLDSRPRTWMRCRR
mmetsp:Transcript_18897/g.60236  ORF Transcript_18897/g.60236 Transcript_18897/m.60236 type:complete len:251 (+) Transcript_18897:282-1034(+)